MRAKSRSTWRIRAVVIAVVLMAGLVPMVTAASPVAAATPGPWDYFDDFSLAANPNGVWHLMYEAGKTYAPASFVLLDGTSDTNCGSGDVDQWRVGATGLPHIGVNKGTAVRQCSTSGFMQPESGNLHPDTSGLSVIGWKSPFTGGVRADGLVGDFDSGGGDGVDWRLMKGSSTLDSGTVANGGADQVFSERTLVAENDFLYLVIDPRAGYDFDLTEISFTVTALPDSFDVNSTDDQTDASPGDEVCATGDLLTGDVPECTLRAAVMEANALAGAQTINVPAGTYTLTAGGGNDGGSDPGPDDTRGDLDVTDDATIVGAGQAQTIIQAGASPFTGIDRVIEFWGDNSSGLNDLTVRNGSAGCCFYVDLGGLVRNNAPSDVLLDGVTVSGGLAACTGGGLFNWNNGGRASGATMTLVDSTVTGNKSAGACAARGGGISSEGDSELHLLRSTVSDNVGGEGGGISSDGVLTMAETTVSGNTASSFGGVRQYGPTTTITDSAFTNNCAGSRDGGGVCQPSATAGALGLGGTTSSVSSVTITGNGASNGAGLFINGGTHTIEGALISQNSGSTAVLHGDSNGIFTMRKSAVTGNTATTHAVAFAANRSFFNPTGILENVTVSGNSHGGINAAHNSTFTNVTVADNGTTGFYANRWYWGDTISFTNVLLADNTTSDCVSENGGGSGPNLTTGGGNLIESGNCPFTGDTTTHKTGVDPALEALAGSGSDRSHPLAATSAAIDAGINGGCPATDQRGVARPQDGPDGNTTATCDIGAYEFELPPDPDSDGVHNPSDNCPDVANPGQADGDGDGVGDVCDPLRHTDFENGADGWTVEGDPSSVTLKTSGGNPGNYLEAIDGAGGLTMFWDAPGEFLGDLSDLYGGSLRFDLIQGTTDSPFEDNEIRLQSGATEIRRQLDHPGTSWSPYDVALTETGWTDASNNPVSETVFRNVLMDLDALLIRAEYRSGVDTDGLDNVSLQAAPDADSDGVPNVSDNCVNDPNAGQADADGDGIGNVCDGDDNDGPLGDLDDDGTNNQNDADDADPCVPSDTVAACDADSDGVVNAEDNCPDDDNPGQNDSDGDGIGNVCDPDDDDGPLGDLDSDGTNNQNDIDDVDPCVPSDTVAVCDSDADLVPDGLDNCPDVANPAQRDADGDDIGNVCDDDDNDGPLGDLDDDGVLNQADVCPDQWGALANGCLVPGGPAPGPGSGPDPDPSPSVPGLPTGDFEPCAGAETLGLCLVDGVMDYDGTYDDETLHIDGGNGGTISGNGNQIHITTATPHQLQVIGSGNTIYCTAPCSGLNLELVGDGNTLVIVAPTDATARSLGAAADGMTVTIDGSDNQVNGSGGDDNFSVTGARNEIKAGAGADSILMTGASGENVLRGGPGADVLKSASGGDLLHGGAGRDTLRGGEGDDTLKGGAGADTLQGGRGNDLLQGGRGEDSLVGGGGTDSCMSGTKQRCE